MHENVIAIVQVRLYLYSRNGQGRPSTPWGHDAFSPLFQISPYFLKILGLSGKFQKFDLSDFSPIFPVLVHFPPDSQKCIISPSTFQNFPPVSQKFNNFLHTLRVFCPPYILWPWCIYASPNTRTGRPWKRGSQVLDLWRQIPDFMYEQVKDPQFL